MQSIYKYITDRMFTAKDMLRFRSFPGTLTEYVEAEMLWRDEVLPYVMLNIACRVTGAEYKDLMSPERKHEVTYARYFAAYFIKKYRPKISTPELGRIIGRDHATVIHGFKKVAEIISQTHEDRYKQWFREVRGLVNAIYSRHDPKAISEAKEKVERIRTHQGEA